VWGLFEGRDQRFSRLDPNMIRRWLGRNVRNELEGMWEDDVPFIDTIFDMAARYDRFLQLKLDPYSCPRLPLPAMSEISGPIEFWIIDFQHWARRRLSNDETADSLHELYHHLVVESHSQQLTRVIFH
jgi:hypothetical protein